MAEKTVKQFSAHLELPNHIACDLVGDDLAQLKDAVNRVTNGGLRFEPAANGPSATIMLYHPTFGNGQAPMGWISTVEVPESMTNKAIIERRLQAA